MAGTYVTAIVPSVAVRPVVVNVIPVLPTTAPADTAEAPATVNESVSTPPDVTFSEKVRTIVFSAVRIAVKVGACPSDTV